MTIFAKNMSVTTKPKPAYLPLGIFTKFLSEYYFSLSLKMQIFRNSDVNEVECLATDWGTFLTLLHVHIGKKIKQTAKNSLLGYCNWLGGSSKAKTNAITMLVIDFPAKFDIDKLAPQFSSIERASYMTYDLKTGAEIFRVLLPLCTPIKLEKFLILKPFIQKWVDGDGSHPPADPASYDVGRFLYFPDYCNVDNSPPNVECDSPGWILDENAFDELMNTGVLTLT